MEEAFQLDWVKLPSPAVTLVRESCAAFLSSSPDVSVDSAALTSFVSRLRARGALEAAPTRQFPLNFPTPRSEINFIATLALLQIGSGYRTPLHAQERGQGRGAAETMMFGCMGMHISGEITADAMVAVGLFDVAQMFGLKIQEEYEISTGIRSERRTELYSLAELIRRILTDTGSMLKNLACRDFAEFFFKFTPKVAEVDPATGEARPPQAALLLGKLVRHFKWLQDAYVIKTTPAEAAAIEADAAASSSSGAAPAAGSARVVYVLKKAQLMCADLYNRFRDDPELSSIFGFGDVASLTAFSDNVVPAVLRAEGVLRYSDQLASIVDQPKLLTDRRMEAAIRAAAVVACDAIVKEYNEQAAADGAASAATTPLTAMALDYHLWLIGKTPEFRSIERHSTHSGFY